MCLIWGSRLKPFINLKGICKRHKIQSGIKAQYGCKYVPQERKLYIKNIPVHNLFRKRGTIDYDMLTFMDGQYDPQN